MLRFSIFIRSCCAFEILSENQKISFFASKTSRSYLFLGPFLFFDGKKGGFAVNFSCYAFKFCQSLHLGLSPQQHISRAVLSANQLLHALAFFTKQETWQVSGLTENRRGSLHIAPFCRRSNVHTNPSLPTFRLCWMNFGVRGVTKNSKTERMLTLNLLPS
jgi:hypothetical protein